MSDYIKAPIAISISTATNKIRIIPNSIPDFKHLLWHLNIFTPSFSPYRTVSSLSHSGVTPLPHSSLLSAASLFPRRHLIFPYLTLLLSLVTLWWWWWCVCGGGSGGDLCCMAVSSMACFIQRWERVISLSNTLSDSGCVTCNPASCKSRLTIGAEDLGMSADVYSNINQPPHGHRERPTEVDGLSTVCIKYTWRGCL